MPFVPEKNVGKVEDLRQT